MGRKKEKKKKDKSQTNDRYEMSHVTTTDNPEHGNQDKSNKDMDFF